VSQSVRTASDGFQLLNEAYESKRWDDAIAISRALLEMMQNGDDPPLQFSSLSSDPEYQRKYVIMICESFAKTAALGTSLDELTSSVVSLLRTLNAKNN
jgi:hypothetical protein